YFRITVTRYSPPSQGGVAAPSSKCREASLAAQTGRLIKSMSAKRSLEWGALRDLLFGCCATLTTAPSAPLRGTGIFLGGASTPPWKGGDYSARDALLSRFVTVFANDVLRRITQD